MLYSIVAILVVILDQAVKYWVTNTLFGTDIVKFIPGVVSLVNVHNTGAAFGFLSGGGARIYFIVITVVFVLLVIIALATNFISGRVSRWAIVLVAAGGFANCIDRVIYGYVVDMFKVELFEFAVFNVADIFITVFAIVFALAMIFERQDTDDEDEFYDDDDDDDEDEDEEEAPKRERKPLFSKIRKNRDLDDDDDEDTAPASQPARRQRKPNYAQEYEQYKAERAARERANGAAASAASSRPAPAARVDNSNNPFAEWEQANERAASQRSGTYAAKAMGTNAPDYSRPIAQSKPTPARPSAPVKQAAPVRQSAAPKPQQAAPAPKKQEAKPGSSTEYNLDDILAEFK